MTTTLLEQIQALDAPIKEALCGHIKQAVYHLAECWDALRDAEEVLQEANSSFDSFDIETDDIEVLTAETSDPSDAFKSTDATVLEYLGVK